VTGDSVFFFSGKWDWKKGQIYTRDLAITYGVAQFCKDGKSSLTSIKAFKIIK